MNFENAIKQSSGDYIFLSDQDDIWIHDKVSKSISKLQESNGEMKLLVHKAIIIDGAGIGSQIRTLKKHYSLWDMLVHPPFSGCTMCMTRNFIEYATPFPRRTVAHDIWLMLLAYISKQLVILDEPLIKYRKHGDNVSANIHNSLWFKVYYRLQLLLSATSRLIFRRNK